MPISLDRHLSEAQLTFREGLLWIDRGDVPSALQRFFRRLPTGHWVAPASDYGAIHHEAESSSAALVDAASRFAEVDLQHYAEELDPFDFQIQAIRAWEGAGRRGTIVLPTGAGKSYTTRLLIVALGVRDARCSTLVIVPTRTLLYQWHAQLRRAFRRPIGIVGDDILDLQPVTVTTYASSRVHMRGSGTGGSCSCSMSSTASSPMVRRATRLVFARPVPAGADGHSRTEGATASRKTGGACGIFPHHRGDD